MSNILQKSSNAREKPPPKLPPERRPNLVTIVVLEGHYNVVTTSQCCNIVCAQKGVTML